MLLSLQEQIRQILDDFETTSSEKIIKSLNEIKIHFKSDLTREYLQGKMDAVSKSDDESERKKLCKNLIPYLDWYLQGN